MQREITDSAPAGWAASPAQRDFLVRHGCGLCQGYLFGVPQPLENYERELDGRLPSSNAAFLPQ